MINTYNYIRLLLFLAISATLPFVLLNCADENQEKDDQPVSSDSTHVEGELELLRDAALAPFYHGVASGDPLHDRVIIWTRVTPQKEGEVKVNWKVATDSTMKSVVQHGSFMTNNARDYTVKVDVSDLEAGNSYYYQFEAFGKESVIGRTKTLPDSTQQVTLGFASCSNYEWGYFNAYQVMARDNLDAVVHLGDYIYEYAPGSYGDTTIGRINIPAKEILNLQDYRTRYSQYRLDPDLQAVHAAHPFITVWDDHEIANNAYVEGAENHQHEEGDWHTRKEIARKVYYEWMPVRDNEDLFRSFAFGNLVHLSMLDTRLAGRTVQVDNLHDANYSDSSRSILGRTQFDWLTGNLKKGHIWKVIGNQVPFGTLNTSMDGKEEKYMDGWDGYPAERAALINEMVLNNIRNVIFATGDYHSSFALENDLTGTADANDNVAVEFVVPSITSANIDEYVSADTALLAGQIYMKVNPHMKYANMTEHGYVRMRFTPASVAADFVYVNDLRSMNTALKLTKTFLVKAAESVLIDAEATTRMQ